MILLLVFAFLAGIITVLSPCILPILPIILSSSVGGEDIGKSRSFGVVTGFVLSFTLFTLFLSTLVRVSGVSADILRNVSVFVIAFFGLSLLIPQFQIVFERVFSRLSQLVPKSAPRRGFGPGLILGLSLGLLWTPCVGPILAAVISLALTGSVNLSAFLITFAYAVGAALPMFLVMWGGRALLQRNPWLLRNTQNIQKAFGVLMILTAVAIYTNVDRAFQTYIISTFPQYGAGLTTLEDQGFIQRALENLQPKSDPSPATNQSQTTVPKRSDQLAPEIIPGGVWINSAPLSLAELRGKVVIIDFWTYSCINCQRTLPYLKQWYERYGGKGLVIIGVHAPEFEFEKSEQNVRKAVRDFGLQYPIVQDNNFATWRAYANRYWPAKYFIDKDGFIRHTHFGEGGYEESERVIQALLAETGADAKQPITKDRDTGNFAQTSETYLGYDRIQNFSSLEKIIPDVTERYTSPGTLPRDSVAYEGDWVVRAESATPAAGSQLTFNFDAKEVFLVMRPKSGGAAMRVFVDGSPQYPGADVMDGVLQVDADRLYHVVELPVPGRHVLRLDFSDDNIELFAFTFG